MSTRSDHGGHGRTRLVLCLPATSDAVSSARHAIHVIELDPDLRERMELAVSELVTNAIRHGEDVSGLVHIVLEDTGTSWRLSVTNPGHGFEPPDPDRARPAVGGMGLEIVRRLSTSLDVSCSGDRTVVTSEFANYL